MNFQENSKIHQREIELTLLAHKKIYIAEYIYKLN